MKKKIQIGFLNIVCAASIIMMFASIGLMGVGYYGKK